MELTIEQQKAVDLAVEKYRNGEKQIVIAGYAGSGKAQPNDTIIPTPNGDRLLGELKIGDYVYDRMGKPTRILGVFPQGLLDSYIVTLEDGRQTRCNNEHIWTYYTSKGNLNNKTLQQMMDAGLKYSIKKGGYKFKIPTNQAIQYEEKQYKIDPYVIGCFLGDGCCKEKDLIISSENDEIPSEISRIIKATLKKESSKNYNWKFIWNESHYNEITSRYNKNIKTLEFFKDYTNEICVGAENKRIPEEYLYGSIDQRFDLIQGLMDTDGNICSKDENRFNLRFTSISLNLIKDFQKLLYGLGYKSTITEDKRSEKYVTGICYTLNIHVPNEDKYKFFRLKRKKDIAIKAGQFHKRKNYNKIAIINIEKEPIQREMTCIYVDNPEHLYLTNDYIVTHNTYTARYIIEALLQFGINPETDVGFGTFTGKAAQVLARKGNKNSKTLHKILYDNIPNDDGTYYHKPKENIEFKVLVVDEVSMVPEEMVQLLQSYPCFVIYLGDPFQIPPINPKESNTLLQHPDVFFKNIMRQAEESEIIRLSMKIRNGESISYYKGKEIQIMNKKELTKGVLTWADTIITATNKMRCAVNTEVRNILGYPPNEITDGDKITCLKNEWDRISDQGMCLINGTVGYFKKPIKKDYWIPRDLELETKAKKVPLLNGRFISDFGDDFGAFNIDRQFLYTEKEFFSLKDRMKISRCRRYKYLLPLQFSYAYGITCHRAQGSEWDKVLVIEENFPFSKEDHARWLYTSVTRASSKLVLIKKN